MADPLAVDEWSGTGVRVTEVTAALSDLRHRSRETGSPRTAVMTFVAVARDDDDARAAGAALRALGSHHPSRIVILRPDPDSVATLDAHAALFSVESDGHEVNFEEISLTVCGQAAKHLDSIADAFTISDLPVAVWYVGSIPDAADPLLSVATATLVDSRDAGDPARLRWLLDLSRQRPIVDLSWVRLKPWRSLLAALFSEPAARKWLRGVESVSVSGKAGPRHVLGGWAAAQLGLSPQQVQLRDDRHVRVDLACSVDGDRATFEVGRRSGERTLEARAVLPEGGCPPLHLSLAEDALPASLADALVHLEPDAVWQRALQAATLLDA